MMALSEFEMLADVVDHVSEFARMVSEGDLEIESDEAAKELAAVARAIVYRVMEYARQHERAH
jgi:hypothetical protein